tara:strand:+ start:4685 stop:5515 length:831 start_codon:yes stop_codon:yes gene_type:complete
MLRHRSEIKGYAIHASDGLVGTISDFLFDDHTWMVRWMVVDTGQWLSDRKVLLPLSAISHVNHIAHQFNVKLTQQQIEDCPATDTDLPVSRQNETNIYDHYAWSPYWIDGSYMSQPAGIGMAVAGISPISGPSEELVHRALEIDELQRAKSDPALRSADEVTGYNIHASDGEIGHVDDFLVDDENWSIHHLVINTSNWWLGHKVLISPLSVRKIKWADRTVCLDVNRQTIKDSPPYDPSAEISVRENHIHRYDGDHRANEITRKRSNATNENLNRP